MDWAVSSYRMNEASGDVIDHGWACQNRKCTVERKQHGGRWALTAKRLTPIYLGTAALPPSGAGIQILGLELSPSSVVPGEPFLVNKLADVSWSGGYQRIKCKVTAVGSDSVTVSGGAGSVFPPAGTTVNVQLRDFAGISLGKNECLVPTVVRNDGDDWGIGCHELTLAGRFVRTEAKQAKEYLWSKGELASDGKCWYLVQCEGILNPSRIRFTLRYQSGFPTMTATSVVIDVPAADIPTNSLFGVAVVFGGMQVTMHVATAAGKTFTVTGVRVPHHPVPDKKTVIGSRAGNEGWTGVIYGWCASGFMWSSSDLLNYTVGGQVPVDIVSTTPGAAVANESSVMVTEVEMPNTSIYWAKPIKVNDLEFRWYWSSDHGGSPGAISGIYTGVSGGYLDFPSERTLFIGGTVETPHFCNDPRVPFPLIAHEVLPNWSGWPQFQQGATLPQMSYFYDSSGQRQNPAVPFTYCNVPMEFLYYTHTGYVETAVTSEGVLVAFGAGKDGTHYGNVKSTWNGTVFEINPGSPQLNPWDGMQQGIQVQWWRNQFAIGSRRFGVGKCRVGEDGIYHYSAAIVELCPVTLLPLHPVNVIVLRDHVGSLLGEVEPDVIPNISANLNYVQDVTAVFDPETTTLYVYVLHGMREMSGRSMLRGHRYQIGWIGGA